MHLLYPGSHASGVYFKIKGKIMANPIRNLKVFFKQLIIIITITIAMLILGIVTNIGLSSQKTLLSQLIDSRFHFFEQSTFILEQVLTFDNEFELFIAKIDKVIDFAEANDFITKIKDQIDGSISLIEDNLANKTMLDEERVRFTSTLDELKKYKQTCISIIVVGQINRIILDNFITQIRKSSQNVKETVSDLRNYEKRIVSESKNNGNMELDRQIAFSWIVCAIAIFIPFLISILISRTIVVPINSLVDFSQHISEGDLTKQCNINSKDEMGHLSVYFSSVVNNIREIISSIKGVQGHNMELKDKLVSSTQETFAATTEIAANLNSSINMLSNLNEGVSASVKASEKIEETFSDFKNQIDNQATSVNQSSVSIKKIVEAIQNVAVLSDKRSSKSIELLQITDVGGSKMQETNKKVKEMSAITDDILGAIDVIKDIADQTNLLSINSAIQAAHAGDTGKGFAVIANEIGRLAESSSDSSKIITQNLEKNVEMIKNLLAISDEASNYFQTIGEEVKQVVNTLKEISTSMQSLTMSGQDISMTMTTLQDITRNVSDNSDNIESGMAQIRQAVVKVNNVTSEVINAITQINIGSEQINSAMSMLSKDSVALEEGIVNVNKALDKFKTE